MEIDHENTNNIICPYCGYEYVDSWEFEGDSDEESKLIAKVAQNSF